MQMFNCRYSNLLFIIIVVMLSLTCSVYGQSEDGIENRLLTDSLYVEENPVMDMKKNGPWNFSNTMGSSLMFIPGYGTNARIFAAPHLDFSATDRLSFHGGMVMSRNMPIYPGITGEGVNLKAFTNLSMFVAASYQLTNELVIYGAGMKSMINPALDMNDPNFLMDDFSIGAAYKLGNFTIGASFSKGNSNRYNSSPFIPGRGHYQSPFYW